MRVSAIPAVLLVLSVLPVSALAGPCDPEPGAILTPAVTAPPRQPPSGGTGTIEGKVTDATGSAYAKAEVLLSAENGAYSASTFSLADGSFRFASVPAGEYLLTARAPSLRAKESYTGITVTASSSQSFSLVMIPPGAPSGPVAYDLAEEQVMAHSEGYADGASFLSAPAQDRLGYIGGVTGGVIGNVHAGGRDPGGDEYWPRTDSAVRRAIEEPLSTFAVDVDTASYSNVRRYLRSNSLPPADAVRIEELVNYFRYELAAPAPGQPISVTTEVADCPWAPSHRLLRVGLGTESRTAEGTPRSLMFLIDVSGSMGEPDKLPLVKESLRLLVNRLGARDEVSIVTYANSAGVVLPPTPGSDKKTILCAIERLEAGGSTNGSGGIQTAYALAESTGKRGAISRVILATDGDFNVGVTDDDELVKLIESEREKGIALTALGFGTGNLMDSRMEALADHGNGNYAYVDGLEEARKVLDQEMTATLVTVAKDVKIQVEMNPANVGEWRLIGYENRALGERDFEDPRKDAGDVGAGHQVTALYEIVPAKPVGSRLASDAPLRYQARTARTASHLDELAFVSVRWTPPSGGAPRQLETSVRVESRPLTAASPSLRFAAAVAAFGLKLRGGESGIIIAWQDVHSLAASALERDELGLRSQFLELVDTATKLKGDG